MNDYVPIFSAAGVFVGNFIYHSWKGDPKGAIIGLIAAVLVLAFFGIRHAITG